MVVFKSPFSKRVHSVRPYDMEDFILPNSKTQERKSEEFNMDALTKRGWNENAFSFRKEVFNDLTLEEDFMRKSARRFNRSTLKARKWRNF